MTSQNLYQDHTITDEIQERTRVNQLQQTLQSIKRFISQTTTFKNPTITVSFDTSTNQNILEILFDSQREDEIPEVQIPMGFSEDNLIPIEIINKKISDELNELVLLGLTEYRL